MENPNNEVDEKNNETVEGNEGTGATDTQTVGNQNEGNSEGTEQENKTENKEETLEEKAQKLADGMLKKKMKNMPSKEELKAFKEWKEAQKTDEEKKAEHNAEFENLKKENQLLKNEKTILKLNVDSKYVDFINFEVSKMDGDFDENLEEYLKNNPQYSRSESQENKGSSSNGTSVKNGSQKTDGVEAILKQKHPDLF